MCLFCFPTLIPTSHYVVHYGPSASLFRFFPLTMKLNNDPIETSVAMLVFIHSLCGSFLCVRVEITDRT